MSDADIGAIQALETLRCKALAEVDIATLKGLFSDTLIHVHATGLVQTKAEFLAGLQANRPFIRVERGDLNIRVHGDTALITGLMTNTVRRAEEPEPVQVHAFATQVLAKEDGCWRYIAFQATAGSKLPLA